MHTVVETARFLQDADRLQISEAERMQIVLAVSREPTLGDLLVGTGGVRKFRWARPGAGKSGGYRVVSLFVSPKAPVFLLNVFAKNVQANVSPSERETLRKLTRAIKQAVEGSSDE